MMVMFQGPALFSMGSPTSEPGRDRVEFRHRRLIDRSFAIGAHEVTVEQFRRFQPDLEYSSTVTHDPECPANRITWYAAAAYCRWLTAQDRLPEDQQCYPEKIGPDMRLPDDFLSRTGYRLPTEAEWEYACRAGSSTPWFFGGDGSMLDRYAWFGKNSDDHLWPVGQREPNPRGLFDLYGNVLEWCHGTMTITPENPAELVIRDDRFRVGPQELRSLRGGGYNYSIRETRSAKRFDMSPNQRTSFLGLRVARTIQ